MNSQSFSPLAHANIRFSLCLKQHGLRCCIFNFRECLFFPIFQFVATDDPLEKTTTAEAIRTLISFYHSSQYHYTAKEKVEEISKVVSNLMSVYSFLSSERLLWIVSRQYMTVELLLLQKGTVLDSGGSQASFLMQTFTLTKRSFVNMSRDFGYYWLRLIIYIVVTICIGTIYFNVGTGYHSILVFSELRAVPLFP